MTIPSHILSRKILAQCPELNISESQLGEAIEVIMKGHKPFKQPYGVISHYVELDAEWAKMRKCSFCSNVGKIYHGYKLVNYPYDYIAFFECPECKHTEEI